MFERDLAHRKRPIILWNVCSGENGTAPIHDGSVDALEDTVLLWILGNVRANHGPHVSG